MSNETITFEENRALQLNNTSIQFCPMCSNLMKYFIDNEGGFWKCPVCDYDLKANKFTVTLQETQPDSDDYRLYINDPTLKRILHHCPVCNDTTEMVVFYGKEKTMVNNYVCTRCRNLLTMDE